jgi:hypothetical protein
MKILQSISDWNLDWGVAYIKDLDMRISHRKGTIAIVDLSNAHKRGKKCLKASISNKNYNLDGNDYLNYLTKVFQDDFKVMLNVLSLQLEYSNEDRYQVSTSFESFSVEVNITEEGSKNTFSPFALKQLKPLTEMPKKWSLDHVIKALANDQFSDFRCDGVYSDDYAFDAAFNYRKGVLDNDQVAEYLKGLVECGGSHRKGYFIHEREENRIDVSCYSFQYHSFKLELEKEEVPV